MRIAFLGAGLGIVAALALTRLMAGLLYGVTPWDATTLVAVTAVLCGAALAATYVPARHATRIDPLVALRSD
jgi:putative ABC transport system permease protein